MDVQQGNQFNLYRTNLQLESVTCTKCAYSIAVISDMDRAQARVTMANHWDRVHSGKKEE